MRTPASIGGHPIHAMLIVFPVGLLIFSLICDLISLRSADPTTWATVAFYTMVGGFIVESGSVVLDGSLEGQLERIRRRLASG